MADHFPPAGATDCHVHVIGPKARFPLAKERTYTPMDAPAANLAAMLKRLGLDRVVLVQPSFYGTDNTCMLDCMAALPGSRGVAVLRANARLRARRSAQTRRARPARQHRDRRRRLARRHARCDRGDGEALCPQRLARADL